MTRRTERNDFGSRAELILESYGLTPESSYSPKSSVFPRWGDPSKRSLEVEVKGGVHAIDDLKLVAPWSFAYSLLNSGPTPFSFHLPQSAFEDHRPDVWMDHDTYRSHLVFSRSEGEKVNLYGSFTLGTDPNIVLDNASLIKEMIHILKERRRAPLILDPDASSKISLQLEMSNLGPKSIDRTSRIIRNISGSTSNILRAHKLRNPGNPEYALELSPD